MVRYKGFTKLSKKELYLHTACCDSHMESILNEFEGLIQFHCNSCRKLSAVVLLENFKEM